MAASKLIDMLLYAWYGAPGRVKITKKYSVTRSLAVFTVIIDFPIQWDKFFLKYRVYKGFLNFFHRKLSPSTDFKENVQTSFYRGQSTVPKRFLKPPNIDVIGVLFTSLKLTYIIEDIVFIEHNGISHDVIHLSVMYMTRDVINRYMTSLITSALTGQSSKIWRKASGYENLRKFDGRHECKDGLINNTNPA